MKTMPVLRIIDTCAVSRAYIVSGYEPVFYCDMAVSACDISVTAYV